MSEDNRLNEDWICNEYFGSLGEEITRGIDQIYAPSNWGLTLIATIIIFIVTRSSYPDTISLYVTQILLIIGIHFFTFALKGYINVIRFSTLRKKIIRYKLFENNSINKLMEIKTDIRKYEVNWILPIKKIDVLKKGLLELGFGYIFLIILGVLFYTIYHIKMSWWEIIISIILFLMAVVQIVIFLKSPYMKNSEVEEHAQKLK